MDTEAIISVDQLTRRFGEFTAVDRVNFQVQPAEIFGYLGANGAGKSTTIRMLCGLLTPSSGRAQVAHIDVAQNPEQVKQRIGYMSQRFSLYLDLTVSENLEFFGGAYGLFGRKQKNRAAQLLEQVGLSAQHDQITGQLPGGWRQRLALACALLHNPSILFLDEPTAGVDPGSRRNFWRLIRSLSQSGTTVFVTTHYMDEAEYCDRVGLMTDGRLAALDTPAGLKQTHLPGCWLRVKGVDKASLLKLSALSQISSIQSFGAAYHIQVQADEIQSRRLIQSVLSDVNQKPVTIESIQPTLEDVFLQVVGGGSKHSPKRDQL